MKWMEEVRKSLQRLGDQVFALTRLYNEELADAIGRENIASLESAVNQANKALAAIPDEPEMIKLLGWLNSYYSALEKAFMGLEQLEQQVVDLPEAAMRVRHVEEAFEHIYQYVERELGYKLPEEDSGKENDSPEKSQAGGEVVPEA